MATFKAQKVDPQPGMQLNLGNERGVVTQVVREAVARGELPEGTDPGRALDLVVGPLYWRLVVVRTPLPPGYVDDLARSAVAALKAS